MIRKMFEGAYLRQLDNIVQWSEMDVFQRESVSQHSFKVAVFTRVLLQDIFGDIDEGDMRSPLLRDFKLRCVDYAMFHDFDEALIRRDISHVTKYNRFNGSEIRRNLNELADHLAQEEILADSVSGKFVYDTIIHPESYVKRFVKLCDWLAMAFFIRREQRMGNQNMHLEDTTVYNGVRNAVEDVRNMLKESWFAEFEPKIAPLETIMNMIYEQRN
jgi:5'-deoxynucleotidase YfbR-like HD superfamily hydrolase